MLTASQLRVSDLQNIAHPSVLRSQSPPETVNPSVSDWLAFFSSDIGANLSFEPFMDSPLRGFIYSSHQMNQIWEYSCEDDWENSPAEVTLCPIIAPALLYTHPSTVNYLGQLYPKVFRRPQDNFYPFPLCKLTLSEISHCTSETLSKCE